VKLDPLTLFAEATTTTLQTRLGAHPCERSGYVPGVQFALWANPNARTRGAVGRFQTTGYCARPSISDLNNGCGIWECCYHSRLAVAPVYNDVRSPEGHCYQKAERPL